VDNLSNYRNKRILDGARGAPCMHCTIEDGTIVAAHSNQYRDGRGMHLRSHDFRVAYLCGVCHDHVDKEGRVTKAERTEVWEAAHRATIEYMFLKGIVK